MVSVKLILILGVALAVLVDPSVAWFFRPGGFHFPLNIFGNRFTTTTTTTTTAAPVTTTTPAPIQISAGFVSGQGSIFGGYPSNGFYYPNLIGGSGNSGGITFPGSVGGVAGVGGFVRPPGGYYPVVGGLATAAGK